LRIVDRVEVEESFLTVAEVAETLKLNQQTVRNWIDQGSLPALRVGRRVRIRRSDFDRLLTEGYSGDADAGVQSGTAARGGSAEPPRQSGSAAPPAGPNADDFWGGEPVGRAEPPRSDRGTGA
jgi:excisionase family DNA binding protein